MVHTGQFYKILYKKEVKYIEKKYNESINLISVKINDVYVNKGITTTFYKSYGINYMFIEVDFVKMLNKSDIEEKDYSSICNKINKFLLDLIGYEVELTLIRLDYRLDIKITNNMDKQFLIGVMDKCISKCGFKKKYNQYSTCKYFNSRSTQFKIYDKDAERQFKGIKPKTYEKNVLRLEVALQNKHLNYKKRKGYNKKLKTYLNKQFYLNYFNEIFSNILYYGDFMKIYKADKIINKSTINDKEKKQVREFLIDVSKHREIDNVLMMSNNYGKKKYTKYKYKKIINILNDLNINPILIPKNLNGVSSFIENPFKSLIVCN